jgi:putative ABC transport system ATP-binding protein
MRMNPKLDVQNLSYSIEGEAIVDGVSFAIAERDILAIIGPSGAGKSSLLRLLNRLDEPTEGTVYLDGRDYHDIAPQTLRRRVGYVPQQPALRDGTVHENITIGPRLRGEDIDEEDVQRLLARVDLGGYETRKVTELSGGEQQRIAIARSVFNQSEVLLLDEPTSSLDADAEAQVETLLTELIAEFNLTCILVTHDRTQAKRLAERVAVLEDSCIVSIGEPTEVLA